MTGDRDSAARPAPPDSGGSYSALRLMAAVLPLGERVFRKRFFLTLGLLVSAALLNAVVPIFFAAAVDAFSGDPTWALAQ